MKNTKKIIAFVAMLAMVAVACFALVACGEKPGDKDIIDNVTFSAPEGTPSLAMLRLATDNAKIGDISVTYKVVKPANIAAEMSAKKSDIVIMPVNGGANLIRQGAGYKLVSIAVDGSLYMVGNTKNGGKISIDDIKGKRIACIGQTGVPGLVFRYVLSANGITIVDENTAPNENQVSVRYAPDGTAAAQLLKGGQVNFMVVGEPAATAQSNKLKLNAEMNLQAEYAKASGASNYPQAGLFVSERLYSNEKFMSELFSALAASKKWVNENKADVTSFAQTNLYESANFPAIAIDRCAINATVLDDTQKKQVITFLEKVMPKDAKGNAIDWQSAKSLIF